jgi:hypothetical protein
MDALYRCIHSLIYYREGYKNARSKWPRCASPAAPEATNVEGYRA